LGKFLGNAKSRAKLCGIQQAGSFRPKSAMQVGDQLMAGLYMNAVTLQFAVIESQWINRRQTHTSRQNRRIYSRDLNTSRPVDLSRNTSQPFSVRRYLKRSSDSLFAQKMKRSLREPLKVQPAGVARLLLSSLKCSPAPILGPSNSQHAATYSPCLPNGNRANSSQSQGSVGPRCWSTTAI